MQLAKAGLKYREIAAHLGIAAGTVKVHFQHIAFKTGKTMRDYRGRPPHAYLSCECQHYRCGECAGRCRHCEARCWCGCHAPAKEVA